MKRALIVAGFTALLVVVPVTASAEDLVPLEEAIPANTDTVRFAPVFDFDGDGCLPSAAIGNNGLPNPGLGDESRTANCRTVNFLESSNTLHRYARAVNDGHVYEAHFYVLYFEKDQCWDEWDPFDLCGHRHDLEQIIVWTTDGVITHVCASAHGDCVPKPAADVPFIGEHPAIVYHEDGILTHAFRFANSSDIGNPENPYGDFVIPPIASWYELSGEGLFPIWPFWPLTNAVMRALLTAYDYGSANLPIKDPSFVDGWLNSLSVRPPGYPAFGSQGPPLADDDSFAVAEDAPLGSLVGTVLASDPDGDDDLTYTITSGNTGDVFDVDPSTGAITVAAVLDYETKPSYSLSVLVFDGLYSDTATISATVTDVIEDPGNAAPQADDSVHSVAENAAVGSLVGTVSASDVDGDDLSYAITGGNSGGAFAINNTTGAITVASPLDYETTNAYTLKVSVSDGALSDAATITVNVTDIDDTIEFVDDDASVFEADIEWLAAQGITKGCNPPANDRFCPADSVTRGQMAAFLHRALDGIVELTGLPVDFTDDDDSIFMADIAWLSATGITKGCSATEFCPNDPVTRGQMAAFLVRALGYADDGGGNLFTDDDDSIFEGDIDRLATAGVTRGCNPPINDRFCPGNNVTRGQMAAFLHRALG